MKIKISKMEKEKYAKEDIKIKKLQNALIDSKIEQACFILENILNETRFKTKFNTPEKNLTKYLFLKLLEDSKIPNETLNQFYQILWERETESLREIGVFILGFLYSQFPENYYNPTLELAKRCTSWNDIDNLVVYVIEEHIAKNYDLYLKKFNSLITHENQWIRRLVIVALGRGFFITKNKEYLTKCFEIIEKSFTDSRKIILDANSFIIGTLGFRIDPEQVANYFEKYFSSQNPVIIKLFCDVVKRSKLIKKIPLELKNTIILSLKNWEKNDNIRIRKSVESALKFIGGDDSG